MDCVRNFKWLFIYRMACLINSGLRKNFVLPWMNKISMFVSWNIDYLWYLNKSDINFCYTEAVEKLMSELVTSPSWKNNDIFHIISYKHVLFKNVALFTNPHYFFGHSTANHCSVHTKSLVEGGRFTWKYNVCSFNNVCILFYSGWAWIEIVESPAQFYQKNPKSGADF